MRQEIYDDPHAFGEQTHGLVQVERQDAIDKETGAIDEQLGENHDKGKKRIKFMPIRSEERRVGKEGRSRWSP